MTAPTRGVLPPAYASSFLGKSLLNCSAIESERDARNRDDSPKELSGHRGHLRCSFFHLAGEVPSISRKPCATKIDDDQHPFFLLKQLNPDADMRRLALDAWLSIDYLLHLGSE